MVAYKGDLNFKNLTRKEKLVLQKSKARVRIVKILLVVTMVVGILYFNPNIIVNLKSNIMNVSIGTGIYKSKVLRLQKEEYVYQEAGGTTKKGIQKISVQINQGKFKGKILTIENNYDNSNPYSYVMKKGDRLYLSVEEKNGDIKNAYIYDYDRGMYIAILSATFILSVILIGGKKGIKTCLCIAVTLPIVTKLIPYFILKGYNYIIVILMFSLILIGILTVIMEGISKESIATMLGSVGGMLVGGGFIYVFQYLCKITGISSDQIQLLLYNGKNINFTGVLFASLVIGSLGAIMHMSLNVTRAMQKADLETMNIKVTDLMKIGFKEGKASLGAMTNTLILAYLGATLQVIIIFMVSNNVTLLQGINGETIVLEILRIITGVLGFMAAIPATTLVYGFLYKKEFLNKKYV